MFSIVGSTAIAQDLDGNVGPAFSDTLTFARAAAMLEANSPQLRAAQAEARQMDRSAKVDALYPNPSLSVQEERTNLADGVDDQWYLSVNQSIRYPGEQGARRRAHDATRRMADATVNETRTRLLNELRHRYLNVAVAQARVTVLQDVTGQVRDAERAAHIRFEEGDLGTFQKARLQVARARYENDLSEAQLRLRDARIELAYLLVPDARATLNEVKALGAYHVEGGAQALLSSRAPAPRRIDEAEALQQAMARRGAVHAARNRLDVRTADLDAARYGRYPSLNLSAGPKRQSLPSSTTYGYTAGIVIGLPLWNGGRAAVDAERNRREVARAELESTRRDVEIQVHDALERVDSFGERLRVVGQQVLPGTDSLASDARFVYGEGEISLFELLDAVDAATQAALLRLDLRQGFLRALYDLEHAIGVGFEDEPIVVNGALEVQR
ncbi:TolC family protein [Longibacter salinarum]|nr:TolC family protein [Longibacter salinarum]